MGPPSASTSRPEAAASPPLADAGAFAAFADLLPEALLLVDGEGRLHAANRAAAAFLRVPAHELAGRALQEFAPGDTERLARLLREGSRSSCLLPGSLTLVPRGAGPVDCRCEAAVTRPRSGSAAALLLLRVSTKAAAVNQFIVLNQRVEALAQEVARRRHAEAKLAQADRRKDEFLSMLGHELRNPLAPLHTGVHLLQRAPKLPAEVAHIARMMARQLAHMTRLVDDLLDVARITRGHIELRKSPIALAPVLEQAVEMSRALIEQRAHALSLHGDAGALRVQADATRLVQVFGNLLNNAAKFTAPGGRIELAVSAHDDEAWVAVRDNGEGIDPGLLPEVFDLFVQGQGSLDRAQGGLGIGLTVVRAIVEMHGGRIRAHSEGPGRGSEFTVVLPLCSKHAPKPCAHDAEMNFQGG